MKQKKISTLLLTLTCSFTSISNKLVLGAQCFPDDEKSSSLIISSTIENTNNSQKKPKQEENLLRGHESAVYCVRWSHDDRFIASGSADNTVRIWKVITDDNQKIKSIKLLQICEGHKGTVNSVTWSPKDKYIASASNDKTVRLWDSTTGKLVQICEGHTDGVSGVIWSHNKSFFSSFCRRASGSFKDPIRRRSQNLQDKNVMVWLDPEGTLSFVETYFWKNVPQYTLFKDLLKIISGMLLGQIYLKLDTHDDGITDVSWSHEDKYIASASWDKTVRVSSIGRKKERLLTYKGHARPVLSVCWRNKDLKGFVTGSYDANAIIWKVKGKGGKKTLEGHKSNVTCVSLSYDDSLMASGSGGGNTFHKAMDNSVRIWDMKEEKEIKMLEGHEEQVLGVAWAHHHLYLASFSCDNTVQIYTHSTVIEECIARCCSDIGSIELPIDILEKIEAFLPNEQILKIDTNSIRSMEWSHDDSFIVLGCSDNTIRVHDRGTGDQLAIY